MLKIENAALIDGLRKMNAHVTRLEADRHRVLESQPMSGSGEFCQAATSVPFLLEHC
jgi:hypothetical protein